jgi:hypothetical protein
MISKQLLEAEELLRVSYNYLECGFWSADSMGDERGQALACLILDVQEKIDAAQELIKTARGSDKPEQEAA